MFAGVVGWVGRGEIGWVQCKNIAINIFKYRDEKYIRP